jgi:hypothetical protein
MRDLGGLRGDNDVPSSDLELALPGFWGRGGLDVSWIDPVSLGGCAASGGLWHFLFTWLKTQGIDDALIQPYSGHDSRTSLEIYSKITLADAQDTYNQIIDQFPV